MILAASMVRIQRLEGLIIGTFGRARAPAKIAMIPTPLVGQVAFLALGSSSRRTFDQTTSYVTLKFVLYFLPLFFPFSHYFPVTLFLLPVPSPYVPSPHLSRVVHISRRPL